MFVLYISRLESEWSVEVETFLPRDTIRYEYLSQKHVKQAKNKIFLIFILSFTLSNVDLQIVLALRQVSGIHVKMK